MLLLFSSCQLRRSLRPFFLAALLLLLLSSPAARAHPMPNSVVLLDLHPGGVAAEVQLPLGQLEIAFGHNITEHPETLVQRLGPELRAYIQQHVRPETPDGQPWAVAVRELRIGSAEQTDTGPYQELTAQLWLTPPAGATARAFAFRYDVIVHQLVTHVALVSVRRDWEVGRVGAEQPIDVGVIRLDVVNNVIPPLFISQAGGGWWAGFRGMVALGARHIAEGTDHLLFLLVLLLPAPLLLTKARRWGRFGGVRYALGRLLRVVSAFTLGHSVTLLAGALGWLRLPAQPVETLIAVSILVSAGHAVRPLFPGREGWVAAGFGLVHGLAFASTLAELHLPAGPMALSILGFNIGIELMQLFVIALTVPWLLLLSQTPGYAAVRVAGAVVAAVAALGWLVERISAQANPLTALVARVAQHAPWLLAALAMVAVVSFWRQQKARSMPSF
ncbi:HupE/UreJ family protein [Hymenobacter sp. M29]|uniref:HupE/UreJ family protein n=1 Tax=Hymenobacter mellowenesis TaxID=3063995 RepID=A0ABT9A4T3_9BACT|nr:HupE/UreJ family protein [Hymenobacter sp. M29]MDO7844856.1 HupE/UreJ family protein [Hymenobacter sp. M29]